MNPPIEAPAAPAWHKAVVAVLALAFFVTPYLVSGRPQDSAALGHELVHDGLALVTQHGALRDAQRDPGVGNILATATAPWWGGIADEQALYRPVPMLLLGIAGAASGTYDEAAPADKPFLYHAFALALLVLCSLLVYELGMALFKNAKGALVAAALFATLPIHGEVIYDVAGIAELCAAAFGMAAWLAWLRAGDRPFSNPAQLGLCALLVLLAGLSKESAFALPLVFFLFDLGRAPQSDGGESGGLGRGFSHALSKLPALGLPIAALAIALVARVSVTGQLLPTYLPVNSLDNPLLFEGFLTRAMNALRVMASGVAAIFGVNTLSANWNYSPDYSATQIPIFGAFSLWNLVGLVAVVGTLGLAVMLFQRCRTRAALVFALFGSLLLTSNLLTPIGTIYADRLMFFPSVFAVLFLAAFLARAGNVGVAIGLALALGGGFWTWSNGKHWRDQTQLWTYASEQSAPESARAHFNNGVDAWNDQVATIAVRSFEKAIELYPDYAQAHSYLGDLFTQPQQLDLARAIEHFEEATEIQLANFDYDYPPEPIVDAGSFGPRALLYKVTRLRLFEEDVKDPEAHLAWLDGLIADGYDSAYVHHRRGTTLRVLGAPDEEIVAAFERSLAIDPTVDCVEAYGRYLLDTGRRQEALTHYTSIEDFPLGAQQVRVLLARAEAEFVEGPDAVLDTVNELLALRDDLSLAGEYVFSPEDDFRTLFLRAQARYAMLGDPPTREQLEDVATPLRNAIGAWRVLSDETYEAHALLAQIDQQLGEYEEAMTIIESLRTYRDAPSLRLMLGNLYARVGRAEDALDQFASIDADLRASVEDFPEDEAFRSTLVQTRTTVLAIYRALDRRDDALATIQSWHEKAPSDYDPLALFVHAYWLLGDGDLDGAFELANLLQQSFPEDPSGAQLYQDLRSIRELEARAETEGTPEVYEQLADLRRRVKYTYGAIDMATRAVETTPEDDPALSRRLALLAACHELAGDLQSALGALERALQLDLPDETRAVLDSEVARVRAALEG